MTLIDFQVLGSQLNHESHLPQVSKSDCSSVVVSLTVMLPQRLNPVSLGVCVCVCACVCACVCVCVLCVLCVCVCISNRLGKHTLP